MASKEYMDEWRKNNPEKVKSYRKKWNLKNKDYGKIHYSKNKEYYKEKAKLWCDKNKEKRKEICDNWIKNNPKKIKKIAKDSYEKHKDRHFLRVIANRKFKIQLIKERICCEICSTSKELEIHHKDYSKGNSFGNLLLVCKKCHVQIHNKLFEEKYGIRSKKR